MLPSPPPNGPGDHVAADFCVFHARHYLIFYDLFSHFPFLFPVRAESTTELIRCTQMVFLQTGLPTVFASDNGPAFASSDFQAFLRTCGTKHRASSPRYPQSNGAAERAVQLVKRMLERTPDEASLFQALLLLQNTRRPDLGASPSELFFGRVQRTSVTPVPRPSQVSWQSHRAVLASNSARQAKYYDQRTRVFQGDLSGCVAILRDLVGPVVQVSVLSPAPAPRAYYVRLPSGVVTIRNQAFLRPLPRSLPSPATTAPVPSPGGTSPKGQPSLTDVRPSETVSSGRPDQRTGSSLWDPFLAPPGPVTAYHRLPSSVHQSPRPRLTTSAAVSPVLPPKSPATASRSSSGPANSARSSDTWASAPSVQSLSPPTPVGSAVPANDHRVPLGATRTGRTIYPSLRAAESAATGQWNPWSVVQPRALLPSAKPPSPEPTSTSPPSPRS